MIKAAARRTVRLTYIFAGVLLILLALLTVIARLGLPLLASQKSNIESRVSDYLESPVEIGELSLRWEALGPMLIASDVSVLETSDRKVALEELLIDINLPKTLLRGIPIINELSLVGAKLAIEEDADGQIRLHGMEFKNRQPGTADVTPPAEESSGVDVIAWLFNAKKVGLLNANLTLIDVKTDRQLVLDDLNIRAESDGDFHQLRVDAQLPASLGGRLEAGIDLVSKTRDLTTSSGDLYVAAESLNVGALGVLLRASGLLDDFATAALAFDATASVQAWGTWEDGQIVSARGPLVLDHIVDSDTGQTLFDQVTARLSLAKDTESTEWSLTDFQARSGTQLLQIEKVRARVPAMRASIDETAHTDDSDAAELPMTTTPEQVWDLSAQASELPADLVVRLARMAMMDGQPALKRSLRNLAAEGSLKELSVDVSGSVTEPLINVSAQIDQLQIRGDEGLPSVGPFSGDISLVDSVGLASVQAQQMPLSLPAMSDESLLLDSLTAVIDIDVRNPKHVMVGADVQLVDEGIDTNTRLSATLISGKSPHLDIQSRFEVADITAIKAWLPRKWLPPTATLWIDDAIKAGKATDGTLLFFGNVDEFPFDESEGVFWASVNIIDGELEFLPDSISEGGSDMLLDWPAASNINGNLELNGLTLTGVASDSTLAKFNVSQTRATIENLAAPVLELGLTADGAFQDVVNFGIYGPLQSILEPAIGDMTGNGDAELDLELAVSLFRQPSAKDDGLFARNWQPFKINGSVFFDRNDVTFGRAGLRLNNASGAVGFNESGININNLAGQLLGHDVRIHGQTKGQGSAADTIITIKGILEAKDLLAYYGNPLDQFISGASQWTATITAPHSSERVSSEGVTLDVSSDLEGSRLLVPIPFSKGGATTTRFTLGTAFRTDTTEQIWKARYGDELTAHVRLIDENMHALLIELGDSKLANVNDLLEQPGIRLQGSVQRLAADDWIETVSQYIDSLPVEEGKPEPILPISAILDTDSLILGNQSLGKASLRSNTDDTYLNFAVTNRAMVGTVRYPREHWTKDIALKARLELLDWSVIDALNSGEENATGQRTAGLDPRMLPPIEAKVLALEKDNIRLRDLELRTLPSVNGLDITTFGFAYNTMRLVGQGYWHLGEARKFSTNPYAGHQTNLDLVLHGDDFGIGFDEVGLTGIMDDGQGSIAMKLRWPGPLYLPEIARLDGDIAMNLEAGSIIPFEPGGGRMMGLFAIQALPRRLNLDFKDLTGEGLAFTRITGNATIKNGIANVPLLQLTGPIGVVDIVGTSDLDAQQFDQQVTVLPRVSAALPIIGAITGGATAGIGALVAAGFLKALGVDFDRIGLRTYSLKGPWLQPEFTPVSPDFARQR